MPFVVGSMARKYVKRRDGYRERGKGRKGRKASFLFREEEEGKGNCFVRDVCLCRLPYLTSPRSFVVFCLRFCCWCCLRMYICYVRTITTKRNKKEREKKRTARAHNPVFLFSRNRLCVAYAFLSSSSGSNYVHIICSE